jgi:hypothetical protein
VKGVGIVAANGRTCIVDPTLARFLIEKLAHPFEHVVRFVSKYAADRRRLGIALFRLSVRDMKVTGDSKEIAFGHFDSIVTATVCRTLGTVVEDSKRATVLSHVPIALNAHSVPLMKPSARSFANILSRNPRDTS